MYWKTSISIGLALIAATAHPAVAGDTGSVDYTRQIKPLLKQRCWSCHGALRQQSQLRLDTRSSIIKGGDGGAVIVAGHPEDSVAVHRIASTDLSTRMPPEGAPLSDTQITLFKTWIEQGAAGPETETPEADPRSHWSFTPPIRPAIPQTSLPVNPQHPIDAFVAAELERNGLLAADPAAKSVLLRRVYLDLIGLPPTPDELRAFLADDSITAYDSVVDRLLQDQRHGERWARHWLDIWRYSDWYGRRHVPDVWNSAPQIWRWRDWVVRSLNSDLGYDQMVRAMLAADEIAPEDEDTAVATGYLIRNWYALNPNDWMRNNVEHTGKAFLGLTFNCAHCHDHKYDPILHDDYFRMRAFFEPISVRQDRKAGEADPGPFQEYSYGVLRKIQRAGLVRVFDKNSEAPTWFYTGGDERNRVADRGSIPPGVPSFLAGSPPHVEPVSLPPRDYYPGLRPALQETLLGEARTAVAAATEELAKVKQTQAQPDPQLQQDLVKSEEAYESALREVMRSGEPGALIGEQSLLLDATAGRRMLLNGAKALKSLPDGMTIEFTVKILNDVYFNFQLAKDVTQGLTASVVAFENGRLVSYRPGGVTEFEIGRYNWKGGQKQFEVSMRLDLPSDQCEVTVISTGDRTVLVDSVRVALNGWNPVGDATKGIIIDARTGCVAVIDGIRFLPPVEAVSAINAKPDALLSFEFESPKYVDGKDILSVEGWETTKFSVAPAVSLSSRTAANETLVNACRTILAARRAAKAPLQKQIAAEAKVDAARAQLTAIEAKIVADRAAFGESPDIDVSATSRTASKLEREAALRQTQADVLAQECALSDAESKPVADANRAKEITAAAASLTAAQAAVSKAEAALADESRADKYTRLTPEYPSKSTGRRRALADWIVRRDNPLTARVAINHIWARHFHAPIVGTVYDFGRNGAPPTHPQLIDWLAVELMDSGWSMRRIHRLIVTSDAYRRSISVRGLESNLARDPDNRFLWRMNPGRMEAEVVRDSVLYCGGKLDFKMGGQELENSESLKTCRRSLYYSVHPEVAGKSPLGELFDGPDALDCYRRTESIIPQQALALTNSELVHAMSAAIVQQWPPPTSSGGEIDTDAFVASVFERLLSRSPTSAETRVCGESMMEMRATLTRAQVPEPTLRACEGLVRAIFNHNDFVTIR